MVEKLEEELSKLIGKRVTVSSQLFSITGILDKTDSNEYTIYHYNGGDTCSTFFIAEFVQRIRYRDDTVIFIKW